MKIKKRNKYRNIETRNFLKKLNENFSFTSWENSILDGVMKNYDIFITACKRIDKEGIVVSTKTGTKRNPAVDVKKIAWGSVLSGLKTLDIKEVQEPKNNYNKPGPKKNYR